MNTYQLSKFMHFATKDRAVIAFNLASNGFLLLHKELGEQVKALRHSIGQLQNLHPELFDQMLRMSMIVEAEADEVKALVDQGRRITLWYQFGKERTVPSCSLSFCLHAALSFILFYPC